jgi:hypothetical protein
MGGKKMNDKISMSELILKAELLNTENASLFIEKIQAEARVKALERRVSELEAAAQWRDPEMTPVDERVLTLQRMTFPMAYARDWVGIAEKGINGQWEEDDGTDVECTGWTVIGWRPLPEAGEVKG